MTSVVSTATTVLKLRYMHELANNSKPAHIYYYGTATVATV
jgi:hypothetical protein